MDLARKDLFFWGAVAIGAYVLWQTLQKVMAPAGQAVSAATSGIANLWVSLTASPPLNVLGTVQFPTGNTAPISTLPIRTDGQGNVYTNSNGITYQLQPWVADASGNPVYPAVAVGT